MYSFPVKLWPIEYRLMAYIVMAYIGMAQRVMAYIYGRCPAVNGGLMDVFDDCGCTDVCTDM